MESFSSESEGEEAATAPSPVTAFYKDKAVLVTGATGFMGKVLVEKLLRSTQVRKVFLLIRAKKGVSPEQRLQELLSTPIFDTLKVSCPELAGRVQVLSGDITLPCFGLCAADEKTLIDEVAVIFHSAATIRFDEKLTEAVNLNVVAVQTLMQIAKKMKKLEALVQVSTAYCNTELSKVPEEVQNHGEPARLVSMVQAMEPDLVNSLTPHIIGKNPNTYTFTKALGECVLQQEGDCLPIAIVRPSMVVAAWREPIPGWVDNLNGPTGMMAATGKGVLRSVWLMGDMVADFVPVDICINLLVTVAWRTATKPSKHIPVYHCTSGGTNPITWAELQPLGLKSFERFPFEAIYRYPYATHRENYWANRAAQAVLHNLPAHIMDMVARATGGKEGLVRAVDKLHRCLEVLSFFTTNEYEFEEDNLKNLQDEMDKDDRKIFNFDISDLNWGKFLDDWTKGTRQFVFKEPLSSLPGARRRQQRLYWLEAGITVVFYLILAQLLFFGLF